MTIGNEVLCQDCLRVKPFTDDRHNGVEQCECGGDFCGCGDCNDTIFGLAVGLRNPVVLGVRGAPIGEWTPTGGRQ